MFSSRVTDVQFSLFSLFCCIYAFEDPHTTVYLRSHSSLFFCFWKSFNNFPVSKPILFWSKRCSLWHKWLWSLHFYCTVSYSNDHSYCKEDSQEIDHLIWDFVRNPSLDFWSFYSTSSKVNLVTISPSRF